MKRVALLALIFAALAFSQPPPGYTSLFSGRDLSGWKVPEGDNGHWKVIDGVIDYDARSEAKGAKHLLTEQTFRDFALLVEWRVKETPFVNPNARIIMPDGTYKLGPDGKPIRIGVPDSDSGILLRGGPQINIWCWPVGSGEIWNTRLHKAATPEMRAAATPRINADRNIGEWNSYEITLMGNRVTVRLNGKLVIDNAVVLDLPGEGPIGLQHHGRWDGVKYVGPPSLVQYRNIYVKTL